MAPERWPTVHNIDWGGENRGDILLRIHGLPAGEYEMTCHHNHWEPAGSGKARTRVMGGIRER